MTHRQLSTVFLALLLYGGHAPASKAAPALPADDLLFDDDLLDAIEQDVLSQLPSANYASLSSGRDTDGNTQLNASLQLAVQQDWLLDAGVGYSNINDITPSYSTRSIRLGIGSAGYDGFNWYASYSDWGKSNTIETEDGLIELSYRWQRWSGSVQYQQGDVTLYIAPQFSNRLSSISSGRDAIGASISRSGDSHRWWLSWLHRSYERNVSRINTSAQLQAILQNIALDQAYALTRDEYTAGYQWYWRDLDARVELSRTVSAIDNSSSDFVTLSTRYYVDPAFNVNVSLTTSPGNSLTTLTLGIGISW